MGRQAERGKRTGVGRQSLGSGASRPAAPAPSGGAVHNERGVVIDRLHGRPQGVCAPA